MSTARDFSIGIYGEEIARAPGARPYIGEQTFEAVLPVHRAPGNHPGNVVAARAQRLAIAARQRRRILASRTGDSLGSVRAVLLSTSLADVHTQAAALGRKVKVAGGLFVSLPRTCAHLLVYTSFPPPPLPLLSFSLSFLSTPSSRPRSYTCISSATNVSVCFESVLR